MEDRLKILETKNASLRKYYEYYQVVHKIDHLSDSGVDSSFHKQSMKIDNYVKITEWINSSIGQSTVIEELKKKRSKISDMISLTKSKAHSRVPAWDDPNPIKNIDLKMNPQDSMMFMIHNIYCSLHICLCGIQL